MTVMGIDIPDDYELVTDLDAVIQADWRWTVVSAAYVFSIIEPDRNPWIPVNLQQTPIPIGESGVLYIKPKDVQAKVDAE
jgi:hypothetical protein